MERFLHMIMEPIAVTILLLSGGITFVKLKEIRSLTAESVTVKKGKITGFGASMTALSGTIGTGNIVGVAVAILTGGPGSVVWMCLAALIGMPLKYTEIALCCKYRVSDSTGVHGGPMILLERFCGRQSGRLFAWLCLFTGMGVGNLAQTGAVGQMFRYIHPKASGIEWGAIAGGFAVCLLVGLLGGAKRITGIMTWLTPCMAIGYLLGCFGILFLYAERIPQAISWMFHCAFNKDSITGAAVGTAIKTGVMRGLFTNESGLGSAPIAHAMSEDSPHRAGVWGIFEVWVDTVFLCSMTALTLLVVGISEKDGYLVTIKVFQTVYGITGGIFLTVALWVFALAAAIGWGFYGSQALYYLNPRGTLQNLYIWIYVGISLSGFFLPQKEVLWYTDSINGIMLVFHTVNLLVILLMYKREGKYRRFHSNQRKIKRNKKIS